MRVIEFLVFCAAFLTLCDGKYVKPTVYQKIRQSPKLASFFNLLEGNRPAKLNLQYGEMTVFVPTNEAFAWYSGKNPSELINYHMVWYAKPTKTLHHNSALLSVIDENPPVWITRTEEDVFVNNARLVPEFSNYKAEINSDPRKPQVMHVIDEVLDPMIKRNSLGTSPTAYDLLSRPQFWDLGGHRVEQFHRKMTLNRKADLYKSDGNSTFFVPIDDGFTDYRLQVFDGNVIEGHIIPHRVLFTRPTLKDVPFETLANGDYLYVVIIFSGSESRMYIKSHTLVGDSNHPTGEIVAEIVKANIPVRNGVVHLIKRPLAVLERKMTLFPFLPIVDKFSMDPTLSYSYLLGQSTGFNAVFDADAKTALNAILDANGKARNKFTFFIPRDKAWRNLKSQLGVNATYFDQFVRKYGRSILSRHLIVDEQSYTVADLRGKSKVPDTADIDIRTLGGTLRVGIGDYNNGHVVYWRNKFIPIYKSDYFCADGIVHIVDDVLVTEEDFKATQEAQQLHDLNVLGVLNVLMHLSL